MPPQPNMQAMLKQVQKMQAEMARAQEELAAAEVEATAGGGMVTVRVTGALVVTELSKLPGIGNRTAQRLAFHVLRSADEDAFALADAIREVKQRIGLCEICFNLAEGPRCRICEDERRDPAGICVVEEPSDVIPIERMHEFRGRYHVLGGALSPIAGADADDLRIAELFRRVAAP